MRVVVGDARIDGLLIDLVPIRLLKGPAGPVATPTSRGSDCLSYAPRLMRREDDEPQSGIYQSAHDVVVAGCLWQPHRFRVAAEAIAKVREPPLNLSLPVAFIAQG